MEASATPVRLGDLQDGDRLSTWDEQHDVEAFLRFPVLEVTTELMLAAAATR